MRRILVSLVCLTLMVGAFLATRECIVSAADDTKVKKVAVLPFDVHSSENIDYIRNGVWDMLISRISLAGKIEVVSKNDVQDALAKRKGKGNLTVADVYELGKKMGVDYVVHGSITKIGNSVSLDGKLLDVAAYRSAVDVFAQSQGMDDVIPKIGDFAKRIDYHILGQVPATFGAPPLPSPADTMAIASPQPPAAAPRGARSEPRCAERTSPARQSVHRPRHPAEACPGARAWRSCAAGPGCRCVHCGRSAGTRGRPISWSV